MSKVISEWTEVTPTDPTIKIPKIQSKTFSDFYPVWTWTASTVSIISILLPLFLFIVFGKQWFPEPDGRMIILTWGALGMSSLTLIILAVNSVLRKKAHAALTIQLDEYAKNLKKRYDVVQEWTPSLIMDLALGSTLTLPVEKVNTEVKSQYSEEDESSILVIKTSA